MIGHKIGIDRFQMQFNALEDLIAEDNLVRVVDAFVDSLDLNTYGFHHTETTSIGASAYHTSILLKIYFYGYFNRIRSSRMLEKECTRNIEMQWLINGLTPSYHTIATFRTFKNDDIKINHCKAIKQVFRALNRFLNDEGLFGKKTAATDGTKIRAQNGRKRNFTEDKIKKK
jgi:transposase